MHICDTAGKRSAIAVVCACVWLAHGRDADIGRSFLEQGNVGEAREYITRAYEKDSISAPNVLAYAFIQLDGRRAAQLYRALAADGNAGVDVRTEALTRLGMLFYAQGGYDSACAYFEEAWRLGPASRSTRMLARAAINKGDLVKAEALLAPMVALHEAPPAAEALYYLGNVYLLRQEYEQAMNCYKKSVGSFGAPYTGPSLAGGVLAARKLEKTDLAQALYGKIDQNFDFLLESSLLEPVADSGGSFAEHDIETREGFGAEPAPKNARGSYTLQVGAFASVENARKLRQELLARFDDVTVAPARVRGRTLHKVRIGSFESEADAEAFGNKRLRPKGMTFRVVQK